MSKIIQLEGRNLVYEALHSDRKIREIRIDENANEDPKIKKIKSRAINKGIKFILVPRRKLDKMSKTHAHQGVIAMAFTNLVPKVLEILKDNEESGKNTFFMMVDTLNFERNLGAIARTAYATGVDAVIAPNKGANEESAVVAHTSAGATENIPIITESIFSVIKKLQKAGVKVVGIEKGTGKNYFEADLTGSVALIVGGEDKGLTEQLRERCDELVELPMVNDFSSLNVSVSAGIVMYEKLRQDMIMEAKNKK